MHFCLYSNSNGCNKYLSFCVFSSVCTLTVQQQYTLAAVVRLVAPFWSSRFLRVTGRLAWTLLIYGLQIGTMVELKITQTHILKKESNQGAQQLISVLRLTFLWGPNILSVASAISI